MSLKIIDKNIKTVITSALKLNILIHMTAVLIAEHAAEHGDCTRALTLVNAMPASMRRTMLKLWFETFTPIRFQMKDGLAVKVGMLKDTAKTFTPFDIEAGRETPFYTLAEENPEAKAFDIKRAMKMLEALAARGPKEIEKGNVPAEDVDTIKMFSLTLAGLKFPKLVVNNDAPLVEVVADEPAVKLQAVG